MAPVVGDYDGGGYIQTPHEKVAEGLARKKAQESLEQQTAKTNLITEINNYAHRANDFYNGEIKVGEVLVDDPKLPPYWTIRVNDAEYTCPQLRLGLRDVIALPDGTVHGVDTNGHADHDGKTEYKVDLYSIPNAAGLKFPLASGIEELPRDYLTSEPVYPASNLTVGYSKNGFDLAISRQITYDNTKSLTELRTKLQETLDGSKLRK